MKKVKELLSNTVVEDKDSLIKHPPPLKKMYIYIYIYLFIYLFKEQINKSICK